MRVAQLSDFALETGDAVAHFLTLVEERDGGHHGEPVVADLAEALAHLADLGVDLGGKAAQMLFLAVVAGDAIDLFGNRDRDLSQTHLRLDAPCDADD